MATLVFNEFKLKLFQIYFYWNSETLAYVSKRTISKKAKIEILSRFKEVVETNF